MRKLGRLALLPLAFLIVWVVRWMEKRGTLVRFGTFWHSRLGHMIGNTECYLSERDAGLQPKAFDIWFPDAEKIIIVYDRQEELSAAKLKKACTDSKKEAKILLWPPSFNVKDYSDFRQQFRFIDFQQLVKEQLSD